VPTDQLNRSVEPHQEQLMAQTDESQPASPNVGSEEPVVEETLVEEVSIDGMCGVY
jgi:mycofactocin precursor peptide MftA